GNSLLRNGGNGRFSDVTDPMAEGFGKWAWGAVWTDLNNDGWEDIYLANGYRIDAELADFYAPGDSKVIFVKVL
ncbi:MAG: VCBS repeat-containing protein, partial [Gammaproteobacteria bacterium]|nr:VCBS repeat-containing protein [Gammaproteobacteria bacterium]